MTKTIVSYDVNYMLTFYCFLLILHCPVHQLVCISTKNRSMYVLSKYTAFISCETLLNTNTVLLN